MTSAPSWNCLWAYYFQFEDQSLWTGRRSSHGLTTLSDWQCGKPLNGDINFVTGALASAQAAPQPWIRYVDDTFSSGSTVKTNCRNSNSTPMDDVQQKVRDRNCLGRRVELICNKKSKRKELDHQSVAVRWNGYPEGSKETWWDTQNNLKGASPNNTL